MYKARVSEAGDVELPAELREMVGLAAGGDVVIELDDGDIRIRSVRQIVERAQALSRQMLAGRENVSVDDFLAERRLDSREP